MIPTCLTACADSEGAPSSYSAPKLMEQFVFCAPVRHVILSDHCSSNSVPHLLGLDPLLPSLASLFVSSPDPSLPLLPSTLAIPHARLLPHCCEVFLVETKGWNSYHFWNSIHSLCNSMGLDPTLKYQM